VQLAEHCGYYTETSYAGRTPKKLPPLPFETSYSSWNDKLRTLGFDFGATFRNSTSIHADGTSHHVKADISIAQECGLMTGESRYVIHPTNIDSCLQLSVMAIANGRIEDVMHGTVLTRFDDLVIWPPTPADIMSKKLVLTSWTKRDGIRSSICEAQLVGHDGRLLSYFEGFQCVAYEAAQLSSAKCLDEDLYASENWELDIDYLRSLTTTGTMLPLSMQRYLELFLHKDATMRMLLVGNALSQYLPNRGFATSVTIVIDNPMEFEQCERAHIGGKATKVLRKADFFSRDQLAEYDGKYDVIICVPETCMDETLYNLRPLLRQYGQLLTVQSRDRKDASI
jgi:hypothetical protein